MLCIRFLCALKLDWVELKQNKLLINFHCDCYYRINANLSYVVIVVYIVVDIS